MRFITQAAKVLNEQKKSKRRLAVFMCLAAVVALGTVAALKMYGQAMSHKEKRLICTVEAHRHTDACYDADGNLVCGQADYLVHTHNDDCYGADGGLVCHLPEIAAHTHTDACYTEEDVLVCTEQEQAHQHTDACYTPQRGELTCQMEEHTHGDDCYDSETGELTCQLEEHQHGDACYAWEEVLTCPYAAGGHQHSSDCYTRERGELTCPLEEHTHGDDCYDENGELTCQIEEHTHDDNCYAWENVLTCQLEETPAGHTHTDACYEKKKVLTCGQLELHTHTEDCYDENGALACGLLELKEHTHQEECFETVELTDQEVAQRLEQEKMEESFQGEDPGNAPENGTANAPDNNTGNVSGDSISSDETGSVSGDSVSGDSISADSVSGNSVSGDEIDIVSDNDADVHEHDETCYDAAGGLMCGYEDVAEPTITQTYKDENEKYIVTAAYKKDANIPEDAELRAEMITAESDGEYFAKREAEMKETLQDEDAKMDALFKIGFYEDGKEIEPESDVMVTVQFLNEEGLTDGTPMTIIHFGEDGNEILGGSHVKDKSTTFKTNGFSEFAAIFRNVLTATQVEPALSGLNMDTAEEDGERTETNSDNSAVSADSMSANTVSGDKGNYYGIIRGRQEEGTEQQTKDIEKEMTPPQNVIISGNYAYKGNGYDVTFHVEGRATVSGNVSSDDLQGSPATDSEPSSDKKDIPDDETLGNEIETSEEGTDGDASEAGSPESNPDEEGIGTEGSGDASGETPSEEDAGSGEIIEDAGMDDGAADDTTDEGQGTSEEQTETIIQDSTNEKLEFRIKDLGEDSKEHEVVMDYIETQENNDNHLVLQILSYSMTYDGATVDLSECKVTADVSIKKKNLKKYISQLSGGNTENKEIKLEAAEVLDQSEINVIDNTVVHEENKIMTCALEDDNLVTTADITSDPHFTVQYYAYLDRPVMDEGGQLSVIDTSGKKGLPINQRTTTRPKKNLKIITEGENTGKILKRTQLTEVYQEDDDYTYIKAPNMMYFNKLQENKNYELKEIWIFNGIQNDQLSISEQKKSTDKKYWTVKENPDNVGFTNRDQEPTTGKDIVKIVDGMTIRLVYNATPGEHDENADFYDYDITENGTRTAKSSKDVSNVKLAGLGINDPSNYDDTGKTLFAFGNANTGTGLSGQRMADNSLSNELNKYNRFGDSGGDPNDSDGCTFNIARSLKSDGTIQYNTEVISVPKLFNEDGADETKGRYPVTGHSLTFERKGDGYTLTSVKKDDKKTSVLENLNRFNNPTVNATNGQSTTHTHIWTNNFWPMDNETHNDGKTGKADSIGKWGGITTQKYQGYSGEATFPASDDGIDHNNMFGLHYTVNFSLTEDYVGPLDYLFFGDDDMWVFLEKLNEDGTWDPSFVDSEGNSKNGKLICDIGGVHSSVGEYVDLWDYIEKDPTINTHKAGNYRLTFFYTERGLSGSTCYMEFTLPSVSKDKPDQTTGHLQVFKEAVTIQNGKEETLTASDALSNKEYEFSIILSKNQGGLDDDYSYTVYKKNTDPSQKDTPLGTYLIDKNGNISSGTTFKLKHDQYIEIKYLPIGTTYTVTEKGDPAYNFYTDMTLDGQDVGTDQQGERKVSGTITENEKGSTITIKYKNKLHIYNLPHTGGFGTILYTIAGVLVLSLGAGFMYKKRIIERRR